MKRLTEKDVKKDLDTVAGYSQNDAKLAWRRKKKKLDALIEELEPIQNKIIELYEEKQPIMDKIAELRQTMVQECVHPKDYLVHKGTHVECKFCDKIIKLKR
jgi:chromosome segregation ATPase